MVFQERSLGGITIMNVRNMDSPQSPDSVDSCLMDWVGQLQTTTSTSYRPH